MFDSPWFVPAVIMNVSAIWLVFLLSWVVARHRATSAFYWWVAAAGMTAIGSGLQAIDFFTWHHPALTAVWLALTFSSALAMVASGRRFRGEAPPQWWKWGIGVGVFAVCQWLVLQGHPVATARIPGVLFQSFSHLYFGWVFWPRRNERVGVGAPLVSVCSGLWGLHILDYPLVAHDAGLFAIGYWFSAMLHVGLGVGMIIDLFEQSHTREQTMGRQLQQANQELLRTVSALSESRSEAEVSATIAREQEALVRQIVHDLRNATQAISLITEDIDDAVGDDPKVGVSLAALDRQVRFISNFLKEKLAWIVDRSEAPGGGTELATAFEALTATFDPIFASKHQTFLAEAAPAAALRHSPVQFEQVVGNLLRNAHLHCPPGTRVRLWTAISDGWATFYVSDDGPGIPLAAQGHLGRGKGRADGSGIGLANVHELVTAAGGLFGVVSEEGRGSTFYVTLPLAWWGLRVPGDQTVAV